MVDCLSWPVLSLFLFGKVGSRFAHRDRPRLNFGSSFSSHAACHYPLSYACKLLLLMSSSLELALLYFLSLTLPLNH